MKLTPVFIPPLATVLAGAETARGNALSEADVVALRDSASCVMMTPADAEALRVERGVRVDGDELLRMLEAAAASCATLAAP